MPRYFYQICHRTARAKGTDALRAKGGANKKKAKITRERAPPAMTADAAMAAAARRANTGALGQCDRL